MHDYRSIKDREEYKRKKRALSKDKEDRSVSIYQTVNGYAVVRMLENKVIESKIFSSHIEAWNYGFLWVDPYHLYSEKH